MVDKKYYEKLGGFSYVLAELRNKIGRQQTDILINDAVNLCKQWFMGELNCNLNDIALEISKLLSLETDLITG